MKIYRNFSTDPCFNLACEEYLLFHEDEPVFMLWQNEPSVIIGRNQNAYAEVNTAFTEEHGIKVVRRLTGGGAVFHDLGNLNYTFIVPEKDSSVLNFSYFAAPIIGALKDLGVHAELSGRNDLTVDGKKISGNAQCVRSGKILHHGTLLFSADMSYLSEALRVDPEKIRSKGIKSVRSRVGNLKEYLPHLTVNEFKTFLESRVAGERAVFSEEDQTAIASLVASKYATWEWNFGTSKTFQKSVKRRFPMGTVEISYNADGGRLTEVKIYGDFFSVGDVSALEAHMIGCPLETNALHERLLSSTAPIAGISVSELAELFLS